MKTKIKILAAIIFLIALSSCSVFTEGPRYRSLNKVQAHPQKSAICTTVGETDSITTQKISESESITDSIRTTVSVSDITSNKTIVKRTSFNMQQKIQTGKSFRRPSLQMNTRKTARINKNSICVDQPSETKLGLFSICFIASVVLTLIGFIAGWSGAWILLILIGVVLPVIILLVWILLIFSACN